MILTRALVLSVLPLLVVGEQFEIPAVEAIVNKVLHNYSKWVNFKGHSSYSDTSKRSTTTTVAKRGLAYNNNNPDSNAAYANLFAGYSKISWGYDWGYPSWGLDSDFELYSLKQLSPGLRGC